MTLFYRAAFAGLALAVCSLPSLAQEKPVANDIPSTFTPPAPPHPIAAKPDFDYIKRVEMIPMRDGVKLYTVIVIPKAAKNVPIILTRTPYNAAGRALPPHHRGVGPTPPGAGAGRNAPPREDVPRMLDELNLGDEVFVKAGYIRVYQDVRGKYGSEGPYLMTPPPVNGRFNPTGADDTTDAYDTIDWLVKNLPESNGSVGMLGSSYEGFTVVMALINPHPALKVAAPESPMIDGWMGDDWFHYGAFRQVARLLHLPQTTARRAGPAHAARKDATTTPTSSRKAPPATSPALRVRTTPLLAHRRLPSRIRRLLAGPGPRQNRGRHVLSPSPLCGCKASGTRKTCGEPSTATRPRAEGHQPTPRTTSSWVRGSTARSTAKATSSAPAPGTATPPPTSAPRSCFPSSTSTSTKARPKPTLRPSSSTTPARTTGTASNPGR